MTFDQIQKQFREIAASLGVDREIPTEACTSGSGVHAEFANGDFFYILTECAECGGKPVREKTNDPNEFLRWFIRDLTYELAVDWADENRVPRKDHRRLWYNKHVEILRTINNEWANLEAERYRECLRNYPYDDLEQDRIDYIKEFQSKQLFRLSLAKAFALAEKRFPLPKPEADPDIAG